MNAAVVVVMLVMVMEISRMISMAQECGGRVFFFLSPHGDGIGAGDDSGHNGGGTYGFKHEHSTKVIR